MTFALYLEINSNLPDWKKDKKTSFRQYNYHKNLFSTEYEFRIKRVTKLLRSTKTILTLIPGRTTIFQRKKVEYPGTTCYGNTTDLLGKNSSNLKYKH